MRSQDFLTLFLISSPEKLTTFLVVVTFKPRTKLVVPEGTFKRENSVVEIWQLLIRGPLAVGGPLPWYNQHNG